MRNKDKKSKSNGKNTGPNIYQGDIRLTIESAEDYNEVNRFYEILKAIGNLSIVSYNWSEKKGLNIMISLKDSIALEDILLQIPQVEQVYSKKKMITVVFNTTLLETSTPVLGVSREGALAS